ncbi:MAG: MlaD family protein [Planctomycetota bacterium]
MATGSSNKINEWKLGLFVVGGLVLGILSILWLAASRLKRDTYDAVVYFDESVEGLELGSPVKFRGVTIGQVSEISVADDSRHVAVTTAMYEEVVEKLGLESVLSGGSELVETGFRLQLVTSPLTGVSFVQGDFFEGENLKPQNLPFETRGITLYAVPSTFKNLEEGLGAAIASVPRIANQVSSLLARVERTLDEAQVGEMMVSLRSVLQKVDEKISTLDDSPVMSELEGTLVEARALFASLRADDGPLLQLAGRYDELGSDLQLALERADLAATTASVRSFAESAGNAADEATLLSREFRDEIDSVFEALDALRDLARTLQREPDSLLRGRDVRPLPSSR